MTLIELLVAMAVTTIVMVGLTGVLYDVTASYQGWATRLDDATVGGALAAAIQEDSTRYVICAKVDQAPSLEFCVPGTGTRTVAYTVAREGATWSIFRQELPGGKTIRMARGVPQMPTFKTECIPGAGTVSGHIHVHNYRSAAPGEQAFSVYYHAPNPKEVDGCPR